MRGYVDEGQRRFTWLVVLLLFVAAVLFTRNHAEGQTSPQSSEIPVPDLYTKLNLPEFGKRVDEVLGARFGGFWQADLPSGPVLSVGAVDPTPADEEAILQAAGEARQQVRVVRVKYSRQQLLDFHKTADNVVKTTSTSGSSSIGLLPDLNRIEITVGSDDLALVDKVRAVLPPDAVEARVVPGKLEFRSLANRETYPPYRAGLKITIYDVTTSGVCTSGFTMVVASGPNAGLNQGLSAGHCGTNNKEVRAGGPNADAVRVGVTNSNTFYPSADTALGDSVLIGFSNQADATNELFVNDLLVRRVTGWVADQSIVLHMPVCKSGVVTRVTCGTITRTPPFTINRVNYTDPETREEKQKRITNLACANFSAFYGDSGSPVYLPLDVLAGPSAIAVGGLANGYLWNSVIFTESCFDPIENIMRSTGTVLRQQ